MEKVETAIERLKLAAQMSEQLYHKPLMVCYSGGKDSDVLVDLAIRAGIPMEIHNAHTTADAPETVYHIRKKFAEWEKMGYICVVEHPKYKGKPATIWSLIVDKGMPPTRLCRYCCEILKESSSKGRMIATGVRWAESSARKARGIYETIERDKAKKIILQNDNDEKRELFETCYLKSERVVNPVVDWSDKDIYDYIDTRKIELNPLYKRGYTRVGCIGCPLAAGKKRWAEFRDYPKYRDLYVRAFDRMIERRRQKGMTTTRWSSGEDCFRWWMEDGNLDGQVSFDDIKEYDYDNT